MLDLEGPRPPGKETAGQHQYFPKPKEGEWVSVIHQLKIKIKIEGNKY